MLMWCTPVGTPRKMEDNSYGHHASRNCSHYKGFLMLGSDDRSVQSTVFMFLAGSRRYPEISYAAK